MIEKYKKKNGSTAYRLQVYLGVDPVTGKQVRTTRQGFKTEREAKKAEVELVEGFKHQRFWKNNDRTTFDEVANLWFELYAKEVRESTLMTTKYSYNTHVKPFFGDKPITKITIALAQKFINEVSSLSTYRMCVSIANRIFKYALHIGVIDSNPLDRTLSVKSTYVSKKTGFENYYNKDQLKDFLDAVKQLYKGDDELLLFFRLLGYGGLRTGEARALENTDFDFLNGTISITKTWSKMPNGWQIQPPKTKNSTRTIVMDKVTMDLAKKVIRKAVKPLHGSFRVVDISLWKSTDRLKRILQEYNFEPITLHGFRHTHASLLYEAGVPVKEASQRLGHSKVEFTLNIYTHLSKAKSEDVLDKLADFIAS